MKAIYFDMDGTIANLYGVEGWLNDLMNEQIRPYAVASPLLNMQALARILNRLQRNGYKLGIVSWTSKEGTLEYNRQVADVKIKWLSQHLKSVRFDDIQIVEYGTPKSTVVKFSNGILFDDELNNRNEWNGTSYDVDNIINVLKELK
jgi:hypothetical protein